MGYNPFKPDHRTTEEKREDYARDHAAFVVDKALTELALEMANCDPCYLMDYFQGAVADLNYTDVEKRHREYFKAKADLEKPAVKLAGPFVDRSPALNGR